MKLREIVKVKPEKVGHVHKNGIKLEVNEEKTLNYLTLFGFEIELIRPTITARVKNPDILISGAVWEVKTPTSSKYNTIKNRFREASHQATKIIFDLRFVEGDTDKVEKQIVEMFKNGGKVRRLMIVDGSGKLLDFYK